MLGVGPLRRPHLVGDALAALLGHDGGGQRPSALWEWDVTTDQTTDHHGRTQRTSTVSHGHQR
jgi:hypothetical protein